jgi:hypothetical protein
MSFQSMEDPVFGEVIAIYTRSEALADGVLIDASAMAREAGFKWPVAITAAAWEDCVAWTESDSERQTHQDQSGDCGMYCSWPLTRHVQKPMQIRNCFLSCTASHAMAARLQRH